MGFISDGESDQLTGGGGLLEISEKYYPYFGGTSVKKPITWTFPSGSKIHYEAYVDRR